MTVAKSTVATSTQEYPEYFELVHEATLAEKETTFEYEGPISGKLYEAKGHYQLCATIEIGASGKQIPLREARGFTVTESTAEAVAKEEAAAKLKHEEEVAAKHKAEEEAATKRHEEEATGNATPFTPVVAPAPTPVVTPPIVAPALPTVKPITKPVSKKLAKALKQCEKLKKHSRRVACEKWAKKVFQNEGVGVWVLNLWGVSPRIGGCGGALSIRDQ